MGTSFFHYGLSAMAVCILAACSHTLHVESEPAGADVFVGGDVSVAGQNVGKTPLALEYDKNFPSSSGYVTLQKPGFQRMTIYVHRGSFGGISETIRVKMPEGRTAGDLATQLFTYVRRAQQLHASGQYDAAHAEIDKALELDPNFAVGLSFKGSLYYIQNRRKEAEEYFRKALAIDPRYDEPARMLIKMGMTPHSEQPVQSNDVTTSAHTDSTASDGSPRGKPR